MVREVLLARVARHQRVEVRHLAARLRPQDAPQPLRLLLARAERARHLDQHVGVGQVQGEVAHLGEDDVPHLALAELLVQLLALGVAASGR